MRWKVILLSGCFLSARTFPIISHKHCRRVRLRYAFMIKQKGDVLLETKNSAIENVAMIVKDDLANDILYFMKFYHITNDEHLSYFYIVFYELLSFMIRKEKNKINYIHLSLLNILIYVLLKNIIINHYIHHW